MENGTVSEDKNKLVLDERTLAKLLEAAYVLQEHNRDMRELELSMELKRDQVEAQERAAAASLAPRPQDTKTAPAADYTLTLAQIVETQHYIQVRKLALDEAMSLVAERVMEITQAGGAAIGIVEKTNIHYRATAGLMTPTRGSAVPSDKSLSIPCVKTGQVFRCAEVHSEFLLDPEECRRRGIESMIAVPVFHDGGVVGCLELYYAAKGGFAEQDVHTCQLMAGLITEALARDEEITWKKSLATERAAMLAALEKLQPNLAALVGQAPTAKETVAPNLSPREPSPQVCGKCGHTILGEEQFCGQCGSPRSSDYEPANMQSKVASLWQMQEAKKKDSSEMLAKDDEAREDLPDDLNELLIKASLTESGEEHVPELFKTSDASPTKPLELSGTAGELNAEIENGFPEEVEEPAKPPKEEAAVAITQEKPALPANWSSAASARAFLEQLASTNRAPSLIRFWNARRGDIYLAIAVILVVCVIRWGLWSGHSVNATGTPNTAAAQHKSPEANLSLFDRMLIDLGLADPPDTPEDKGNPTVQVWIDTHTGQYYCPGADLYGKTPKGKFATQREAELDQFQPAYQKACN